MGSDENRELGFPGEQLLSLARKHDEADGIVSLAGVPSLTREQVEPLATTGPRLVVACGLREEPTEGRNESAISVKELFESGLLQMAVVPLYTSGRSGANETRTTGGRGAGRRFRVVTRGNLDRLPEFCR